MKLNKYEVAQRLGYNRLSQLENNVSIMLLAKREGKYIFWYEEDLERYIKEDLQTPLQKRKNESDETV